MVRLTLSDNEAVLMAAAMENWLSDYEEATKQVEHDRTLETVDQYLEVMSGMQEDYAHAQSGLDKLQEAMRVPV